MSKKIEGVLTAIVTPFDEEGGLNVQSLKEQVNRQLAAGNGIFCGGTNGEFFVLNEQEKITVTAACVEKWPVAPMWWLILVRSLPAKRFVWVNRLKNWASTRYP
jgi:hypothetical protein